jgi:hypothetical protein
VPRPDAPRPARTAAIRFSGRAFIVLAALVGLAAVYATDQVVPATSEHQADMRIWLAARASGFLTLGLLTMQVGLGLILSHPTNKTTWKLSKLLFPWHENAWIFVMAFLALHVVTLVADPYAGVGIGGAIVPGLSSYRSAPVALGTIALYALLFTGLTARYTRLLPKGLWLKVPAELSSGRLLDARARRHGLRCPPASTAPRSRRHTPRRTLWVSRSGRPTFSTSLPEASR